MTLIFDEKEKNKRRGIGGHLSHKQVVTTAATVVSAREPKTYSTMAHFRKKWISFKDEFHSDLVEKPLNSSSSSSSSTRIHWKVWKKRKTTSKTDNSPTPQQALFSLNLPIVISTTHNYYENNNNKQQEGRKHYLLKQDEQEQKQPSHRLIQQLTIIPSFNANLFLIVVLVALLVIAFGILQIHRTISIVNTGIDLIRQSFFATISITRTIMTGFMSLFFK